MSEKIAEHSDLRLGPMPTHGCDIDSVLGRTFRAREKQQSVIGQRRAWGGNRVEAVAEIPGWVFVMPCPPAQPGRPFSISYAAWVNQETPA